MPIKSRRAPFALLWNNSDLLAFLIVFLVGPVAGFLLAFLLVFLAALWMTFCSRVRLTSRGSRQNDGKPRGYLG
jgi:hypothetical protein